MLYFPVCSTCSKLSCYRCHSSLNFLQRLLHLLELHHMLQLPQVLHFPKVISMLQVLRNLRVLLQLFNKSNNIENLTCYNPTHCFWSEWQSKACCTQTNFIGMLKSTNHHCCFLHDRWFMVMMCCWATAVGPNPAGTCRRCSWCEITHDISRFWTWVTIFLHVESPMFVCEISMYGSESPLSVNLNCLLMSLIKFDVSIRSVVNEIWVDSV